MLCTVISLISRYIYRKGKLTYYNYRLYKIYFLWSQFTYWRTIFFIPSFVLYDFITAIYIVLCSLILSEYSTIWNYRYQLVTIYIYSIVFIKISKYSGSFAAWNSCKKLSLFQLIRLHTKNRTAHQNGAPPINRRNASNRANAHSRETDAST